MCSIRWPPASRSSAATAVARRAGLPCGVGLGGKRLHQRHRRLEVAEQDEVVDVGDDRLHDSPPAFGIVLEAQQVEQQPEIEPADLGVGDRRQPRGHPFGRVVAHLLDVDRQRARRRQLARVLGGDELLVAVRQQHLRGAMPQVLEAGVPARAACARPRIRPARPATRAVPPPAPGPERPGPAAPSRRAR